jgi:tol-pal system protein YbgF
MMDRTPQFNSRLSRFLVWPTSRPPKAALAILGFGLVLGLGLGLFPSTGHTQDLSVLSDRLDRLERTLTDMQRTVYAGNPPPAAAASGVGSTADAAPTALARIEVRLQRLETQIRELTGKVEEASYHANQVQKRLDTLQADTDYRLRALEGGAPPAPVAGTGQQGNAAPPASGGQTTAAADANSGRGSLGTISGSQLQLNPPPAGGAPAQTAALPPAGATPEQLYDAAFDLLVRKEFGSAELAFQRFVSEYGDDPLAGNAQYWLGETYYVRERYEDAAVAFLNGYREYPSSPKAPDSLLKLGMSLARAGKTNEACVTLAKVESDYPNAGTQLTRRLFLEKQRLQCA